MENSKSKKIILAVIGVIFDDTKTAILVSKRRSTQSFAGFWELPGGKIEANETLSAALARELHEELDINVTDYYHLAEHTNHFADYSVKVEICQVLSYTNSPIGKEGQEIQWVPLDDLVTLQPLLPGSHQIINLIKIKQKY